MPKFGTENAFPENLRSQNFIKLLSYLKSAPSNCLMAKHWGKAKMPYMGTFGLEFQKPIVIFEISTLKFVKLQNFTKKKCLNLGPEMPDLGILGLEFEKNIVIFEISTLKFVKLQNFAKKQKRLNLRPKMPYLGIFNQEYFIWVFFGLGF